jgi:stearoyl-CoA desaturase (delta-9 desaturase)
VPSNDPTDFAAVRDLARYKELMWLDRHPYLPAALLASATWLLAGWPGLAIGFCWSTVAVWHATFCINSLAHVVGRQRYVTGDQSRNNWLLALLMMGEGWHNNHHAYQASARQGFRWWEYDATYYALRALAWLGIIWDLHLPPRALIEGEQRLGRLVIDTVAGQLAASFPINQIAHEVHESLARAPGWAELKFRIASARNQAGAFWNEIDLPQVPSLEEVRRYAGRQLAQQTPSLEDIAVRARERLLELIHARLVEARSSPHNATTGQGCDRRSSHQNPRHLRPAGVLKGSAAFQSRLSCAIHVSASPAVAKPAAICGRAPVLVTSTAKLPSSC